MLRARHVVGPLYRARGLFVSNVFILDGGAGDRWIIDTGHPVERAALLVGLRRSGYTPRDFTGVLLTHRHSDHAGNAGFLRRVLGVPIFAHRADAEYLEGRRRPPPLRAVTGDPIAWAFTKIENRTRVRVTVDRALDDGDTVGGLEVHHVPGHTEGSVFYRHDTTRSLLSGDALLAAIPPLTIVQGMALPYPDFAVDLAGAIESLRHFHALALPYENLLAGHGDPIMGRARALAEELLDRER